MWRSNTKLRLIKKVRNYKFDPSEIHQNIQKKSSEQNRILTLKWLNSTVRPFRLLSEQNKNVTNEVLLIDHKTRLLILWYDMIWYDMIRCDMCNDITWHDMTWYMIWYIWYDMIWYDMIWYDTIWYDMIWCDMCSDMTWHDIWYDMIYNMIR